MSILILAAAIAAMPLATDVVQPPARHCTIDDRVTAAARAGQNGFQRLDQLPPASLYLTLYRTVDRCPAPVIVRTGVGAPRR